MAMGEEHGNASIAATMPEACNRACKGAPQRSSELSNYWHFRRSGVLASRMAGSQAKRRCYQACRHSIVHLGGEGSTCKNTRDHRRRCQTATRAANGTGRCASR